MESGNFWEPLIPSLEFQDFEKLNSKFNEFRHGDLETAIGFFMGKLEDCFEVRYDSKQQRLYNKSLKSDPSNFIENKLQNLIFKISTSPHLLISRLVKYYQPFSIDELLDSIKTKKIDVFKPLELEPLQLKSILKDSENKTENELENKFRNELINAGKTLIALFLLQHEKKELFDNQSPENDSKIWYRHIRNLIINSGKDDDEIKKQIQNLTIISFNYDRSLDYYLRTRLKQDYYDEIKKKIFYPYGKLAEKEWDLNDYGSFERDGFNPYNEDELNKIRRLGQGLRVIGELDEEVIIQEELDKETKKKLKNFQEVKIDSKSFPGIPTNEILNQKKIRKIDHEFRNIIDTLIETERCFSLENKELSGDNPIKKILNHHQIEIDFFIRRALIIYGLMICNKIYFLGFAFHQSNCDLIALNKLLSVGIKKNIYYTNFDESEGINNAVKEIFYIPSDRFITIHESKKKGVYDALMHDFKLGF